MSILKVAKVAGLSHSTVSRVINNHPGVAPETVRLVRQAMQQTGYVPPVKRRGPQPRSRDGAHTHTIAMIMIGGDPTLMLAPTTASVVHAIETALGDKGFNLVIGKTGNTGRLPPTVESGQVDGLLLHGMAPAPAIAEKLRRCPCVWVMSPRIHRGYWGDRVQPDNHAIGRAAATHLRDQGHRHIAMVYASPRPSHLGFEQRAEAFRQVAEEAGLTAHILVGQPTEARQNVTSPAAHHAVCEQIGRLVALDPRPTGLFIPRDRMTVSAYQAFRAHGIEPGRDITVISCDNDPILDGLHPRPATFDIRPEQIGQRAVDQLLWRLSNPTAPERVDVRVEPTIVMPETHAAQFHVPVPSTTDADSPTHA